MVSGIPAFDGTVLRDARFGYPSFRETDLRVATVLGARPLEVDSSSARLDGVDLGGAGWDAAIRWPEGYVPSDVSLPDEDDEILPHGLRAVREGYL
jgi:hypothetical protein